MARLTFSGIDAEIEKFSRMAKSAGPAMEKAVQAGGKLLAQRLSEAAPVDTGALSRSVKAGKPDYNAGDGYYCEVRPEGKSHGEPLAKIGNILEYGRSNMSPRPWFHPAVARAQEEVKAAMREAFDEAAKEK